MSVNVPADIFLWIGLGIMFIGVGIAVLAGGMIMLSSAIERWKEMKSK